MQQDLPLPRGLVGGGGLPLPSAQATGSLWGLSVLSLSPCLSLVVLQGSVPGPFLCLLSLSFRLSLGSRHSLNLTSRVDFPYSFFSSGWTRSGRGKTGLDAQARSWAAGEFPWPLRSRQQGEGVASQPPHLPRCDLFLEKQREWEGHRRPWAGSSLGLGPALGGAGDAGILGRKAGRALSPSVGWNPWFLVVPIVGLHSASVSVSLSIQPVFLWVRSLLCGCPQVPWFWPAGLCVCIHTHVHTALCARLAHICCVCVSECGLHRCVFMAWPTSLPRGVSASVSASVLPMSASPWQCLPLCVSESLRVWWPQPSEGWR